MLKVIDGYFYENSKPFFWMGDTAWLLFNKLSKEEIIFYLNKRKEQGFNVIQASLTHFKPDDECVKNITDIHNPFKKEFWELVDQIVDYAASINIYMALLPNWGSFVKDKVFTREQFFEYYLFLANRYKNKNNIIWILGGDVRGDVDLTLFNELGSILKANNPDKLIGFHPFGRTASYQWFKDSKWLDFHMFQSGHRRYDQVTMNAWDDNNVDFIFGEDNYKYIDNYHEYHPKPILDGEPSYEGIPQGLHDDTQPYWGEEDARRYAYWSVLSGASGHTYGHNAVMQFYREGDIKSYGVKEEWTTALDSKGAQSMKVLKNLMLKYDFSLSIPYHEIVRNGQKHEYIACRYFPTAILVYTYSVHKFSVGLDKAYKAYLINPLTGEKKLLEDSCWKYGDIDIKETKDTSDWLILFESE